MAEATSTTKNTKSDKEIEKKPEKRVTKKSVPKKVETKPITDLAVDAGENTDKVEVAKAGKRSTKAIKEAEAKAIKEAKKQDPEQTEDDKKPKASQRPPRSKIERKGKKYRELVKQIDQDKVYSISEAMNLVVKSSPSKFDSTVELHVRLGVDPRHADQNIRDSIVLPSGSGKSLKVAVFGEDKDIEAAKKAGADIALGDEFLQQLDKEITDFDILIATPVVMVKLSKYARLLGPKGLMPNPKNGTVTKDTAKAVKDSKAGKVEYRTDETGIIHLGIGKVSFGPEKLLANAEVVLASIKVNKPSSLKGNYVRSIYLSTTMGPSISIDKNI